MANLYKGIEGSPITYLAADISANQTTISIADDSALPDAPNICTIGYGENLETIKYENKSNGVLQNVTRGIEGTPRAWPAGTEVARFFTAYDHNAIIENFNSHLADYANEMPKKVNKEWTEPVLLTLQNNWSGSLRVRKNDLGEVLLYGSITPNSASALVHDTIIAIMPIEYRTSVTPAFSLRQGAHNTVLPGFVLWSNGTFTIVKPACDEAVAGIGFTFQVTYQII